MKRPALKPPATESRGFLLIVVIGVLAVLAVVCVGFLTYTRGELYSVAGQRDKCDGLDVAHAAIDWTLANICKDLIDPATGQMNATLTTGSGTAGVSQCATTGAGYRWWYRPNELGLSAFLNASGWPAQNKNLPYMKQDITEAPWTYLPADYFPGGAVRGRFAVQVLDTNSCININDWNEDCIPSQAQMAHMLMDSYDTGGVERFRQWRDYNIYITDGVNSPARYQEGWRATTHTSRFLWWIFYGGSNIENLASYDWVTGNTSWFGMGGPDWQCMHTTLQSDGMTQLWVPGAKNGSAYGSTVPLYNKCQPQDSPNFEPIDPCSAANATYSGNPINMAGIVTAWNANQHYTMAGYTTQSHVDPESGRSPINVNTCYNSGETYPNNGFDPVPIYTMEGVWNIESLRRLIKVGYFWTGTCFKNAQTQWVVTYGTGNPTDNKPSSTVTTVGGVPLGLDPLTDIEKMKVEMLKTKLAYQYQETLCRYFTGTYARGSMKWPRFYGSTIGTYAKAYPTVPLPPTNYCQVTDYSAPRFNCSVADFRQRVHDDLLLMTAQNIDPKFNNGTPQLPFNSKHPAPQWVLPGQYGWAAPPAGTDPADKFYDGSPNWVQQYDCDRTDGTVSFDSSDRPEVLQGKLDARVAAAVLDNIIPGKPLDPKWSIKDFGKKGSTNAGSPPPGVAGCLDFKTEMDAGPNPGPGGIGTSAYPDGDPCYELYMMQLARQEDVDDKYSINPWYVPGYGYDQDGTGSTFKSTGTYPVTNASWAGGIATINAPSAPFPQGAMVRVTGITPKNNGGYNGRAQCKSPGVFTMACPNPGPYKSDGQVYLDTVAGFWPDNCALPEMAGYPITPGYPSNNQRIDHNDHFGASGSLATINSSASFYNKGHSQNVCAKGRDICIKMGAGATLIYAYDAKPYDPVKKPYKSYDSRFSMGPWIDTQLPSSVPSNMAAGTTPRVTNQIDPQQVDSTGTPDPNNNHVPWRQLSFSPDGFSTELTTSTTTFILIINASVVDAASVNANPGNPKLHRELFWNQWGVVVEIAPGVMPGTDPTDMTNLVVKDTYAAFKQDAAAGSAPYTKGHFPYALNPYPASGGANKACPIYWQWYRNGMPQATKTDANGMDDCCPTLVTRNRDEKATGSIRTQNRWDLTYNNVINDPPASTAAGTPSIKPEHSNATFITDWQTDIHGVPPAGDPGGRGADVIYNPTNQNRKRILIRSIWCLNENVVY
jgi:hypothetical protein